MITNPYLLFWALGWLSAVVFFVCIEWLHAASERSRRIRSARFRQSFPSRVQSRIGWSA